MKMNVKAIETHGLYDLNEFMPKRPTEDDMRIITEMFEASVDGELYDPARWGQHYKPYGLDVPAGYVSTYYNCSCSKSRRS